MSDRQFSEVVRICNDAMALANGLTKERDELRAENERLKAAPKLGTRAEVLDAINREFCIYADCSCHHDWDDRLCGLFDKIKSRLEVIEQEPPTDIMALIDEAYEFIAHIPKDKPVEFPPNLEKAAAYTERCNTAYFMGKELKRLIRERGVKMPEPKADEAFIEHLNRASEIVKSWPKWKQECLGGKAGPSPGELSAEDFIAAFFPDSGLKPEALETVKGLSGETLWRVKKKPIKQDINKEESK